jgi:hypothetical protein
MINALQGSKSSKKDGKRLTLQALLLSAAKSNSSSEFRYCNGRVAV